MFKALDSKYLLTKALAQPQIVFVYYLKELQSHIYLAIANYGTCKATDSKYLLTKAFLNHIYLVTC